MTIIDNHRHQNKADLPEKSGLKMYLKDGEADENSYIVKLDFVKYIKGKAIRCIEIDLNRLEKITGVSKYTWIKYSDKSELTADDAIEKEIIEIMNSENGDDFNNKKVEAWEK